MSYAKTKKEVESPATCLKKNLCKLLNENNVYLMPDDIPTKWEIHGDLVILPQKSLQHDHWAKLGNEVWEVVAKSLKCERIARKHRIMADGFRSPVTELLKGESGWVTHIENHIKLTYDVTKCMFSSGNISEKLRIAVFDCEGETVVDMYAGIGYFTLPYIVHAKANVVHACEWNPHAIAALKKNLELNKVQDKCVVHFGDNKMYCPKGIADRVNLGLIPSSEPGWPTACEALKPLNGGILHVHGVVSSGLKMMCSKDEDSEQDCQFSCNKTIRKEWRMWTKDMSLSLKSIFNKLHKREWDVIVHHVEHIKSYAPHIDHMVADVECRPARDSDD